MAGWLNSMVITGLIQSILSCEVESLRWISEAADSLRNSPHKILRSQPRLLALNPLGNILNGLLDGIV